MTMDDHHEKSRKKNDDAKSLGSGAEAAEGLHSVTEHSPGRKSGVEETKDSDDPGSEPLQDREDNPKGSYGGEGGAPRRPPPAH